MGKIRNLMQSVQEREVIKTAPDMVVYIEGLPYLMNPYLTTNPSRPFLVNFNDHVTAFNASYDIDQMKPSGTISMSVPAHLRYLYQAPGGNNLIKSMMQVQVFMKGYYFANDGNTLFHRVFKGFTSHITHTDDGKSLNISIQCEGILGFFDMMQIDLNPSIQHSSPMSVTALKSTLANMDPYTQMAFIFLYPSLTDGFYTNAITPGGNTTIQATSSTGQNYFDAVNDGFVSKWQPILADICRESHIYGLQTKDVKDVVAVLKALVRTSPKKGSKSWEFLASQEQFLSNVKESNAPVAVYDVNKIRRFHPDMGIGAISLINGRVVTRLEFLRTITRLINYECYQDIDGQIIIKPPIYNLDVTNLGSGVSTDAAAKYHQSHPKNDITNNNNPFIVHLAEITNEVETEDQGAIRATRMVCQEVTTASTQFAQAPQVVQGTAEFMDLPKLAQFGLREEPARTIPWIQNGETFDLFAQAAAEMTLANRGYRTYSFTMPLRPELKLGFPLFIPHRDMYGYVKSVNLQFQIGGTATMAVTLDALRKRLMFPKEQPNPNGTPGVIFVAQPNLVLKWMKGNASGTASGAGSTPKSTSPTTPTTSSASPADARNKQVTTPQPPQTPNAFTTNPPISPDQKSLLGYLQQTTGMYYAPSSDTLDAAWRIQEDTNHIWSAPTPKGASNFFREVSGNAAFSFYSNIRTCIPYTDEKGYEVWAPFPWGRWLDIKTALQEFTRDGYVYLPPGTGSDFKQVMAAETFLYAGLSATTGTSDPSSALLQALGKLQASVGVPPPAANSAGAASVNQKKGVITSSAFTNTQQTLTDITTFELDYSGFTPGGANGIIQVAQPVNSIDSNLIAIAQASETQKVDMFLTGTTPQPDLTLQSQIKAVGNTTRSAGQVPLKPGQFASQK
jgi:hypothetical protein